jgi:hypothetical protein
MEARPDSDRFQCLFSVNWPIADNGTSTLPPIHPNGVANERSSLFHVGGMISALIEWSAGRFSPLGFGVL